MRQSVEAVSQSIKAMITSKGKSSFQITKRVEVNMLGKRAWAAFLAVR